MYVANGKVTTGDDVKYIHTKKEYTVKSLGVLTPEETPSKEL